MPPTSELSAAHVDPEALSLLNQAVQEEKRRRQQAAASNARVERMRQTYRTALTCSMMEGEAPVTFSSERLGCCDSDICSGLLADRSTRLAVVICHPWGPLGGSMHDLVVVTLLGLMAEAGVTTLRFNFRAGVGRGHSSAADLRAACELLRGLQAPPEHLLLIGYSYGACVVADVAPGMSDCPAFALISPPLSVVPALFMGRNVMTSAVACPKPKLAIIGSHDQFCSERRFERFVGTLSQPASAQVVQGAADACRHGGHTHNKRVDHFGIWEYVHGPLVPWIEATFGSPLAQLAASDGRARRDEGDSKERPRSCP